MKHPIPIKAIEKYFRKRTGVYAAYLFGSQARRRSRPNSDVDMAVLLAPNNQADLHKTWTAISKGKTEIESFCKSITHWIEDSPDK